MENYLKYATNLKTNLFNPKKDDFIFISYRSTDREIASRIGNTLQDRGFYTWMDIGSMQFGDKIEDKITVSIKQAKTVIAVLSPQYYQSRWCIKEYEIASDISTRRKRFIFPLIVKSIPGISCDRVYMDFTNDKFFDLNIEILIGELNWK